MIVINVQNSLIPSTFHIKKQSRTELLLELLLVSLTEALIMLLLRAYEVTKAWKICVKAAELQWHLSKHERCSELLLNWLEVDDF